jgi:chromosome condensin MukBEF MukE localization factor
MENVETVYRCFHNTIILYPDEFCYLVRQAVILFVSVLTGNMEYHIILITFYISPNFYIL